MTINARAEEDVEPECVMEKVARASGANYAFHRESGRFQDVGPQAPVVSAAGRGQGGRACPQRLTPHGAGLPPAWLQVLSQVEVRMVTPCLTAGAAPR